jgi:hypothetical protein
MRISRWNGSASLLVEGARAGGQRSGCWSRFAKTLEGNWGYLGGQGIGNSGKWRRGGHSLPELLKVSVATIRRYLRSRNPALSARCCNRVRPYAEANEKGPRWRTSRYRRDEEGQVGQEGQPRQESAKEREKGRWRPRWQQDRQGPGNAEAGGRRNIQGTDEGDRLAASFGALVPVRHGRQKKMGLRVTSARPKTESASIPSSPDPSLIAARAAGFRPGGVSRFRGVVMLDLYQIAPADRPPRSRNTIAAHTPAVFPALCDPGSHPP